MWAATPDPSPLPPVTILGQIGMSLHHPQLRSMSFGTTSTFHTAPTSHPIAACPDTEPHPHQVTSTPHPGIGPYSPHPSLYEQSRNPSPAPPPPISIPQGTATGRMSVSSRHHIEPHIAPHEQLPGSDSPTDSGSNHSLCQSYSHPPSCNMEGGQARQAAQTPLTSSLPHILQHPSPKRSPLTKSMRKVPSQCLSRCAITPPLNPHIISTALSYYMNRPDLMTACSQPCRH